MEEKILSTEAKVGLFVVVISGILFWMTFKLGGCLGVGAPRGYPVKVALETAQGLNLETPVYIAGIQIGKVNDIALEEGKARVILKIFTEYQLEEDVEASIRTMGFLGAKYINIKPGTPGAPVIEPGGEIVRVKIPPDVEELIDELGEVVQDIREVSRSLRAVIGGEEGEASLREIIDNIREASVSLKYDFPVIAGNIRRVSEDLEDLISENREGLRESLEQFQMAAADLQESLDNIASITRKINEGEGSLGKLVNEDETVEKLNETIEGVNEILAVSRRLRAFIDYRGEYLIEDNDLKSHFSLRLQPGADKYYQIGIVDDPQGVTEVTDVYTRDDGETQYTHTEVTERKLKFSLEMAKRFYDLTLRGGIIESTGGVGMDYSLLGDRIIVSFEAFDFGKETNPNLQARLSLEPFRHLYLVGGANDFIDSEIEPRYFFGGGIKFEDRDLKALFGTAGTAASVGGQ
ncbi:MAG: MCE family protein [Deltaproteobacteria bacterium]|nr:MAG: MCE family protein [Deltaproteobacteria bacterium]